MYLFWVECATKIFNLTGTLLMTKHTMYTLLRESYWAWMSEWSPGRSPSKFDMEYLINLFSFEVLLRTWGLPLKWLFHVPFWMTLAKGSIWTTLFRAILKGIWISGLLTRQNIFSRAWQTPSGFGQSVNARLRLASQIPILSFGFASA